MQNTAAKLLNDRLPTSSCAQQTCAWHHQLILAIDANKKRDSFLGELCSAVMVMKGVYHCKLAVSRCAHEAKERRGGDSGDVRGPCTRSFEGLGDRAGKLPAPPLPPPCQDPRLSLWLLLCTAGPQARACRCGVSHDDHRLAKELLSCSVPRGPDNRRRTVCELIHDQQDQRAVANAAPRPTRPRSRRYESGSRCRSCSGPLLYTLSRPARCRQS